MVSFLVHIFHRLTSASVNILAIWAVRQNAITQGNSADSPLEEIQPHDPAANAPEHRHGEREAGEAEEE